MQINNKAITLSDLLNNLRKIKKNIFKAYLKHFSAPALTAVAEQS